MVLENAAIGVCRVHTQEPPHTSETCPAARRRTLYGHENADEALTNLGGMSSRR